MRTSVIKGINFTLFITLLSAVFLAGMSYNHYQNTSTTRPTPDNHHRVTLPTTTYKYPEVEVQS